MTSATTDKLPSRLVFVDLLRGGAILVMIETHVFNTFLAPVLRETVWFRTLTFINGLVAPSFLFVSGFVFMLGSRREAEEFRTFGPAFWKQVRRIGLIWGTGYVLHLPFHSLKKMLTETTPEAWLKFYQVDILQCIAAGLVFLLLSVILIPAEVVRRRWLLLSGTAVVAATPFVWMMDALKLMPAPLAAYLNDQSYSLFPISPWLGYMLIGGAVALRYLEKTEAGREREFIWRTAWVGMGLIALAHLVSWFPLRQDYLTSSPQANPLLFATRLGCVLLLLTACWHCSTRLGEWSFILDASRESLFVYVAHLVIIYSLSWHKVTLAKAYGKSLGVMECLLVSLMLIALTGLGANVWGRLKQRSASAARLVFRALVVALAAFFFLAGS